MNPSIDWCINCEPICDSLSHFDALNEITKSRIVASAFRSSEFLSGIIGQLLKVVDDMLEWFFDHKEHMSHDAQAAYLVKVTKMQDDIDFYLGIRESLYEEVGRYA